MKIVAYLHMYPPIHMAGSETTVHAAMRAMVERGHEVQVIADRTPEPYDFEGVKVLCLPPRGQHEVVRALAKDADILITHLDCTSLAMTLALDLEKPLVHFVHNHAQLNYWHVNPHAFGKAALVIFNSHWIANEQKFKDEPWPGKSMVMHPVIEPEKYRCKSGTKITFCNPTEGKGVSTVHKLAEAMPDYEFLIVEGIYGEQVAPPHLSEEWEAQHPNIEHMKNAPDFRDVLRKTKVLLMPSGYESYGRCAVEAACAGIPSIVHPTQGLWEALSGGNHYPAEASYGLTGEAVTASEVFLDQSIVGTGMVKGAGIFCLRDDIGAWKSQIERLYSDDIYYRSRADAALALAATFQPEKEFNRLEMALFKTLDEWKVRDEVKIVAMWTPNVRLWETSDGKLVREIDGRIPQNAIRQWGLEPISEEVAIRNGLIPGKEAKAIEAPAENKAIAAAAENKAVPQTTKRRARKKVA